jgi:hypothetical protein
LSLEYKQVCELPVVYTIDCLLVKIRNSNGIEFATVAQLLELQRVLQLEIDRR